MAEKRPTPTQLAILRVMLSGGVLTREYRGQGRSAKETVALSGSTATCSRSTLVSLVEKGFVREESHRSRTIGWGWTKTFALTEAGERWAKGEE